VAHHSGQEFLPEAALSNFRNQLAPIAPPALLVVECLVELGFVSAVEDLAEVRARPDVQPDENSS
jgi:hypothetical protein